VVSGQRSEKTSQLREPQAQGTRAEKAVSVFHFPFSAVKVDVKSLAFGVGESGRLVVWLSRYLSGRLVVAIQLDSLAFKSSFQVSGGFPRFNIALKTSYGSVFEPAARGARLIHHPFYCDAVSPRIRGISLGCETLRLRDLTTSRYERMVNQAG